MSIARVTVFGAAQPKPGDAAYQQAYHLGRLLGQAGYTVVTGGYIGTMEAASKGAAEAGVHVIGITCEEIEAWRPVRPNPWVLQEIRYERLRDRLYALIDTCDAALALPGGIGTLAEVAMMWSQMQTGAIPVRPLILVGSEWQTAFKPFVEQMAAYILEKDTRLLGWAEDAEAAVAMLRKL